MPKALGNDVTWKPRAVAIFVTVGLESCIIVHNSVTLLYGNSNVKRSCILYQIVLPQVMTPTLPPHKFASPPCCYHWL
jgi:hypothetical protein